MYVLKFLLRRVSNLFQTSITFTNVYSHIVNWNIYEYITMEKRNTHTCVIYWNKMNNAYAFIGRRYFSSLNFKLLTFLLIGSVFKRFSPPHHPPLTLGTPHYTVTPPFYSDKLREGLYNVEIPLSLCPFNLCMVNICKERFGHNQASVFL